MGPLARRCVSSSLTSHARPRHAFRRHPEARRACSVRMRVALTDSRSDQLLLLEPALVINVSLRTETCVRMTVRADRAARMRARPIASSTLRPRPTCPTRSLPSCSSSLLALRGRRRSLSRGLASNSIAVRCCGATTADGPDRAPWHFGRHNARACYSVELTRPALHPGPARADAALARARLHIPRDVAVHDALSV